MKKNGKIYPWIKSIFRRKKKSPATGVYAGPEMMNPVGTEKPVYAGPDYFGGDDRPVEDVYAGPGFFDKPSPDDAEPEDFPGDTPTDDEEEDGFSFDEPAESEESGPHTDGAALLTYAGPEYSPPPAIEPVMCVYAGPEYWNPKSDEPTGVSLPPEELENEPPLHFDDEGGTRCPACGTVLIGGSEFCHECGMPVKKPEKKDE